MAKQVRSRIWTTVETGLLVANVNFPDKAYSKYKNKDDFNQRVLGAHMADVNGTQEEVFDATKYIDYVSGIIHKYDGMAVVYGMVHDQDVRYDENGDPIYRDGKRTLDLVPRHLHVLVHFSKPVLLGVVAKCLGVPENMMEKNKTRGRYAFSSAMAYLIHALSPKKHQYNPADVINGSFNKDVANESGLYADYVKAHSEEWNNRKATVERKARKLSFDKIYEDTMLGKYTHDDLVGGPDDLYKLYVENQDKLDKARNAYLDRKFIQYNRAVENGDLKIQTLFVFGRAGQGKTRLAKRVASGLVDVSHGTWRVFQTGSQHPFDEYDGQEIILLDDIRANSMNASDWLHLIDPHNNGVASARYHDAKPMPRLLIITTTTPAHEFFAYTKGLGADEPLDQFLRRIQWSANVVDMNNVDLGHRKKLEGSKKLQLDDQVRSRTETSGPYGDRVSVNYKPGNSKSYGYAFEEWASGNFDEVTASLVKFYATYFGLANKRDDLGIIGQHHATGSALPVITDGPKISMETNVDRFRNMFSKNSKGDK